MNLGCFARYICCVFFCTLPSLLWAQRYPFFNLNVENGLVQSQPSCLVQDKTGNLWIGTLGGLSRYDGKAFTTYTVRNGMLDNNVRTLATDSSGNLWVGSSEGLSQYDGKTFKNYVFKNAENNLASSVTSIKTGGRDTIWCTAAGRVYYVTKGKPQLYKTPASNAYVTAILPDNKGFWLAKQGVVYYHHHNVWDSLSFTSLAPNGKPPVITKIYKDKQNKIWLTSNAGLYYIDSGAMKIATLNGQPLTTLPALLAITEDDYGAIWLATYSGAIRYTPKTLQYYNKRNGLSDNIFTDVLTDAEGNLWLASDGQGIFRYSGTQFTALDESLGLPSAQIMGIASDHAGKLYLGTYDAGLYTFQDGVIAPLAFPANPTPSITALAYTHDGRLWIGTRAQGLWRYDKIFKNYMVPMHHLPSNSIAALYTDTSKRLFIGFPNGAIVVVHDTFKTIPVTASVSSFIQIGHDSVLMATSRGIKLYNEGNVTDFKTNTATDSFVAECLAIQGDRLWIGTSDNGVIAYNMHTGKSIIINKSNGLQSDFIYNITTDKEGNVWVGTGFGIHKITLKGTEPVVTFYGREDGIAGMESNHNAVLNMKDGSIWFGTTNGAFHYQPDSKIISSQPISIVMQSVKLFGENITDTTWYDSTDNWYKVPYNLHLPYKKNNIAFTFKAITLSGDQHLLYRYKVVGLDAPWSDWSATNTVSYSALPPGQYVLHVQCNGGTGDKQIQELVYPFEIITPFEKTKWFKLAILGICILAGIGFQYIINTRKQRRLNLLAKLRAEEQGKIRMRTAEDFHDEVGNKLTRINVLVNVLRGKLGKLAPDSERLLAQIEENTGQLYSGTRDILWSLQPSNDNLYEILHRLRDFGVDLFQDTEVDFEFVGTDEKWRKYSLPLDMSRNLIMIFKEALNNCLKYSKATHVKLDVHFKGRDVLQMVLTDNGIGFDVRTIKKGNGINNMNVRALRFNARLYIDSRPGKGSIINLTFKIPSKRG